MWCSSQVNNTVTEGSDHQEIYVYLISHSESILSILIEELKIQLRIFAMKPRVSELCSDPNATGYSYIFQFISDMANTLTHEPTTV